MPSRDDTRTADRSRPVATPMVRDGEVRVLKPGDVPQACLQLARGFADEPGVAALFPDRELRERLIALKTEGVLRATVPYASAFAAEVDDGLRGVAVWDPPGVTAGSARSAVATLTNLSLVGRTAPGLARSVVRDRATWRRVAGQRRRALRAVSRGPVWHLGWLATDPAWRGRGIARRLLDHVLARCDADGLAAWLETTDPVNPPIYQRFGFTTVSHITGGGAVPDYWVMRREPQNS